MTTNSTAASLMQAISTADNDPEIKGNAELNQLLLKHATQLEQGRDFQQVAGDLNQALRVWGMAHLHGPKALDPLYQATVAAAPGISAQKPYAAPSNH
ncbi:bacteriocin immunity protein [Lactiplantibacillus nangangensis]|uniref:Bacteriocin immunity protein n=1 Tax=Lactiplantibacillus nangangensis TaxID=2559917 RepID=A0ABW1SLL1_9LACO|nr:bacteriocin immunity protein [Lactiplantibacillus nangangensis]